MPRDFAGNFTLSAGNPVVTNTLITTAWANPTMSDIANELTNSLDRNGRGRMTVPFRMPDGTAIAPSYSFINDPNCGFYRSASGKISLAIAGAEIIKFGAAGLENIVNGVTVTPSTDNSTKLATTAFVQSVGLSGSLPGQATNAGKFVRTDGVSASWQFAKPNELNFDATVSGFTWTIPNMTSLHEVFIDGLRYRENNFNIAGIGTPGCTVSYNGTNTFGKKLVDVRYWS